MTDYQLLEELVPDIDLRLAAKEEIREEIYKRAVHGEDGFKPFDFWRISDAIYDRERSPNG